MYTSTIHRRRKWRIFGGAVIINRRRAHRRVTVVVCLVASVRPENAVTYSAGNGDAITYSAGNGFCEGFSETAPLQRSNTPSAKRLYEQSAIFLRKARMRIMP